MASLSGAHDINGTVYFRDIGLSKLLVKLLSNPLLEDYFNEFATGFLVGWTEAGVVILIAISIRAIVIHKNPERDSIFAILGAGALVLIM